MPHSFLKDKSNLVVIFLFLLLIILRFIKFPEGILSWDVFGYYLYLPANFIYHDPALQHTGWLDTLMSKYDPSSTLYQLYPMADGKILIKYTAGIAILTFPFFLAAHFLAPLFSFPTDGLSLPYQISMTVGGLVYAFIGLVYFKKIVEQFFEKNIALLVLLVVFFGTNYLQIVAFDGTLLAHNFLFTFYAILVYYTLQWHKKQSTSSAVMIAISLGFISLMRPTEAVIIFFPLLYDVYDWKSFRAKVFLIKNNLPQLLMMIVVVIMVWIPQILYWKYVTGHYFFYSYQNAGEGLDFLSPHTFDFLFSFRKGWLVYTPAMVFSIIGFVFLFLKNRALFYAVFIFTVVNIYIISSWTCWWYAGGSFSARAIIPAYTILAFPLGYFFIWVKHKGKVLRIGIVVIFLLLIALNLFQTWQFENGIISKQRMTKGYYQAIFGKTVVPPGAEKLLLVNRPEDGVEMFENEAEYNRYILFQSNPGDRNGEAFQLMDRETLYSKGIDKQFRELTLKDHAWIRIMAKIKSNSVDDKQRFYLVASFHHKGVPYAYKAKEILLHQGEWLDIRFDYLTPEIRSKTDNLKIYFWNRDRIEDVEIKDFEVAVYEKID